MIYVFFSEEKGGGGLETPAFTELRFYVWKGTVSFAKISGSANMIPFYKETDSKTQSHWPRLRSKEFTSQTLTQRQELIL